MALTKAGSCTKFLRIAENPRYECIKSKKEPLLLPHVSKRIQGWIGNCLQHCEPETRPTALPTRLLDIGGPDDTRLRLLATSKQMLQDASSQIWRYAALSHCWGDPTAGNPPLRTTLENIKERLNDIPFQELPKNYQDAIIVCRSLDIRYLWIDSLCIIQNDRIDWETESPRMAPYYKNAYITSIPAAATPCNDGFLDRSSTKRPPVEVKFQFLTKARRPRFILHWSRSYDGTRILPLLQASSGKQMGNAWLDILRRTVLQTTCLLWQEHHPLELQKVLFV